MTFKEELIRELQNAGAALVGVGDMTAVENCPYPVGISVALPVPKNIIVDLQSKPTKEYYDMYYAWNERLNQIVTIGAAFLKDKGYEAVAQTTDAVAVSKDRRSPIPHKTVATRAGLGWIGKNCLLVTKEYGSAIRISSLLTNAPLETAPPYDRSQCGDCRLCVDACPAKALRQHRTIHCLRLKHHLACKFSAILHKISLLGGSQVASPLYNLTKNLPTQCGA